MRVSGAEDLSNSEFEPVEIDQEIIEKGTVLGAIYFGSRKIKEGGISPIFLICLSAAAGIAAYGL